MKTIRLGNDVQINWYITRFGKPEDFTGKNLTVKLIDKIGNEQVFDYEIDGNRITGIFYGKDQSTNGVYRLLLVENDGKEDMVSLDYIDAFCLSNKMKNQTSNGSDTTSTINTEVEEYESKIDLEQDLFLYAKKTYVNEKIDEVNHRIDNLPSLNAYTKEEADERFTTRKEIDDAFYNKQEIDNNIYTKGQVDKIISEIPRVDTYTKSEIDSKIYDVSNGIPTKTSELTNDSGFATEQWVDNKHYLVASDIAGKADASNVYTKVQVDTKLEGKADVGDIPTKTSDLTNDSGFIDTTALSTLFDGAEYNSETKRINFKHGSNILAYVDATDFIKDGMVESVVIENGYVVITFNTDAGKEAIKIDITDIFNPANYYDKTSINGLLEGKQNVILDLNQIRLDASAGAIAYGWGNHANAGYAKDADLSDVAKSGSYNDLIDKPTIPSLDGYATEQWVEGKHYLVANDVSTFVDASTVYTKVQVDSKLALKADKSEIPTKTSQLTNDSGFVAANDLAGVATSGSYNDLTDKPTIPSAPVQSDWNESDNSNLAFINNKPTIPTKTSQLTNDSGFVRASILSPVSISGSYNDLTDKPTIPSADNFEAKAWRGTQAEYDALTVIEQNRIYIILPTT